MLDLISLPERYLAQLGRDRVAEIIGVKTAMISMWVSRKKFPLDAVQKLLEFDPTPIHDVSPLYPPTQLGKKLVILMPMTHAPEPEVMEAFAKIYDPREMDFKRVSFNNLSVARNALAAYGLRGGWPWFLWWDADTVPPHGDAPRFKEMCQLPQMSDVYAGVNSILRMLVHNRKFVSACYVGRRKGSPPQFSEGDSPSARAMVRRGPRNELLERDWSGFGFTLTHRSVFEDIIKSEGDDILVTNTQLIRRFGYEYSFFTPTDVNTPGDDIPFCARAARAGHKLAIDMSVFAAHIGSHAYTYGDL